MSIASVGMARAMAVAIMASLTAAPMLPPQALKVNLGGHIPFGTNKGGNARAKRAATKARNVKRYRASLKG